MTPTYRYDRDSHSLKEQPVNEWVVTCPCDSCMKTRASLITIECQPGLFWPEGDLRNEVDFFVNGIIPVAFPLTKPPRMFTLEEMRSAVTAGIWMGRDEENHQTNLEILIDEYMEDKFSIINKK